MTTTTPPIEVSVGSEEQQANAIRQHNINAGWLRFVGEECAERWGHAHDGVGHCLRDLLQFATSPVVDSAIRAVQIGACDGAFAEAPGDPFQKLVFAAPNAGALLVEAAPTSFARLVDNLRPWRALRRQDQAGRGGRDDNALVAVNAAVCAAPTRKGGAASAQGANAAALPFYFVAPRFLAEHPSGPHWLKFQLGRLGDDTAIAGELAFYLVQHGIRSPSRFRRAFSFHSLELRVEHRTLKQGSSDQVSAPL